MRVFRLFKRSVYVAQMIERKALVWKIAELSQSNFKGALKGLRQFLIIESPLKMIKNAFYFQLKALFVLKIFKIFSCLFGYVEKTARLER